MTSVCFNKLFLENEICHDELYIVEENTAFDIVLKEELC